MVGDNGGVGGDATVEGRFFLRVAAFDNLQRWEGEDGEGRLAYAALNLRAMCLRYDGGSTKRGEGGKK